MRGGFKYQLYYKCIIYYWTMCQQKILDVIKNNWLLLLKYHM